MALVKVIGGSVVNVFGVPLPSKTVTLKNDDTGTSLTTTTTNADGEWEFANRDETLRYRAEAAVGGSSGQVVVRKPASAEFDHLYANLSFRSAAAATVALGGSLTVAGEIQGATQIHAGPITNAPTTGAESLIVQGDHTAGATRLALVHANNSNTSSGWQGFYRARGTLASRAIVQSTDGLGAIFAHGYDGANYVQAGAIAFEMDGAPGLNDMPGRITFHTTADGAATSTERLRIASNGATTVLGTLGVTGALTAGSELLVSDGLVGAPGLAFTSDPDTGLYRIGANNAAVALGGVKTIDMGGATAATAFSTTATGKVPLRVSGIAAQTADMFQIRNSANTLLFAVEANGQVDILGPANFSGAVGFYGTSPIGGPNTVTGSKGGNAALASLINVLKNMGLFIDSTT